MFNWLPWGDCTGWLSIIHNWLVQLLLVTIVNSHEVVQMQFVCVFPPEIHAKCVEKIRGHFDHPIGVCTNRKGDVIVADTGNHVIKVLNNGRVIDKFGADLKVSNDDLFFYSKLCNQNAVVCDKEKEGNLSFFSSTKCKNVSWEAEDWLDEYNICVQCNGEWTPKCFQ